MLKTSSLYNSLHKIRLLYTITKTKHSTHCSSHQKTSQQQISRIMVRLLAINPNKQISGPSSYSSKKFRDPPFSPPPPTPPPSNLNSDWSLTTVCKPFEKKLHLFERLGHPFARNTNSFERLSHPFTRNTRDLSS